VVAIRASDRLRGKQRVHLIKTELQWIAKGAICVIVLNHANRYGWLRFSRLIDLHALHVVEELSRVFNCDGFFKFLFDVFSLLNNGEGIALLGVVKQISHAHREVTVK
jgi:hypothetical protein